jgi:pre-mRNA-processing factor 40
VQRSLTFRRHFVAGGSDSFQGNNQVIRARDHNEYQMPDRQMTQPSFGASAVQANLNEPELSLEEAEANFFKLLKRAGAQLDWTWEQAMRAIVKDPVYRQIRDPRDRKIAFEKFITEARAADKEREKERQAKLRADFLGMLRTHPEIKYYTRWKSARPIIEKETLFRAAKNEDEKIALFTEYRNELYKENLGQEAADHKTAIDQLALLLNSLDLEPYTRWSDAQGIIQSNERFQADGTFKSLNKLDVIKAFESHIMALERSFNDTRQQQKNAKARRERQNRDHFENLLHELKVAGKIKAGTKWKTIHPLIEDDPRYVAMLGQSGSTPLDLFWDIIEEEERAFRALRNDAYDVLDVSNLLSARHD